MQMLQLSIPEPCHENWQHMTPTEQGRFCNACAKEVIDFSTMTDIQVLNYFNNLTHEKVCGRALPEQLDRTISRPEPPKKKLFWYWNYIVMFFIFFKGNNANAQTCSKQTTIEQLNPNLQANINNALSGKVGQVAVNPNRIITGRVTDENGNPVAFASIKINKTPTGIYADANGAYSIRVKQGDILQISGVGFKEMDVPTATQSILNTVLEKASMGGIEPITVGGLSWRNTDDYYGREDSWNRVVVIAVKDEASGKAIEKAKIIVSKNLSNDSVLTDRRGIYKLKRIKEYDKYFIKVIVDGYESNEFTISEHDFIDRKKQWEVLLKKEKREAVRSNSTAKLGTETPVRLGGVSAVNLSTQPLYVVDGTIISNADSIKPEDIDDITVLQAPQASALFGPDGANGAIVITTRKAKGIKLKEVVITSEFGTRTRRVTMGAMVSGVSVINSYPVLPEKIIKIKTMLTDSIKLYPNPVQRNNEFSVQLKLKQPGSNYQMIITDATSNLLLQKTINAASKDHTEKILADNRWASGIYYISIIDNKNKLISRKSFIFE